MSLRKPILILMALAGALAVACDQAPPTGGGQAAEQLSLASQPGPRAPASFPGIGRQATEAEVAAWDIDVRPDFTGLPDGVGSVEEGEELWIEKCTHCHGDFGDANHVYFPLVGNTTDQDIEAGRVKALAEGGAVITTFTKVATVSTLWDYIHRAMPWDAPKSLSHDEVYAILAYLLNLAEIVPYEYELSHENIAEVQARMPNRDGMTRDHGLWKIDGKPDTSNTACMRDCVAEVSISSQLPDYARDAHGNLADQNRTFGPVRGAVTVEIADVGASFSDAAASATGPDKANEAGIRLFNEKGCAACHGRDQKIVGPGLTEVAEKHGHREDLVSYLSTRIRQGSEGQWGQIPMPPQVSLSDEELAALADWIARGAGE